jgi:arginine deiminase
MWPIEEYDTLGSNVLAVAASAKVIMVSGNPITRSRLEAAGCSVSEFDGSEICLPGAGGPTLPDASLLRA